MSVFATRIARAFRHGSRLALYLSAMPLLAPLHPAYAQNVSGRSGLDAAAPLQNGAENGCGEADKCTTVELLVPSDYDTLTAVGLSALARNLPVRVTTLRTGSSLSQLVRREFGLAMRKGAKVAHEYQEQLLDTVRALNGVSDDRAVLPGAVLLPLVPSYTSVSKAIGRLSAIVPPLTALQTVVPDRETGRLTLQGSPVTERIGALSVLRMHLPRDAAAFIVSAKALARFVPSLVDEPGRTNTAVTLKLATDDPRPGDAAIDLGYLDAGQIAALATRIARPKTSLGRVIVIDSGWPSERERAAAWRRLQELSDIVESKTGVRIDSPPQPGSAFAAPSNAHVVHVEATLDALASLDADRAHPVVTVDYVPLTLEQGARPWLRTLLALGNLARDREATGSDWTQLTDPELDRRKARALAEADRTLAVIPARFGPSGKVTSSSAIIDRTLLLARVAADAALDAGTPERYFVNASWTAPGNALAVNLQSAVGGIVVAALGNEGSVIGDTSNDLDFARRSYGEDGVVGVANLALDGTPICGTNSFDRDKLPLSAMVAFDGAIGRDAALAGPMPPGALCGTSFAAPRVAWLLAAVEATRTRLPTRGGSWVRELGNAVRQARGSANFPQSGWLDVTALMAARP